MERWRIHPDGWLSQKRPDGGEGGLHVRLREQDGRLVITELYLHGDEITSASLRAVPLRALESLADAAWRAAHSEPNERGFFPAAAGIAWTAMDPAPEPTLEELRARKPSGETESQADRSSRRPRLTRPDRSGDLQQFYASVAEAYRDLATQTRAPAVAMAEEAGVPITTAHRWIREARRRGHLPPGRKGRAG